MARFCGFCRWLLQIEKTTTGRKFEKCKNWRAAGEQLRAVGEQLREDRYKKKAVQPLKF